MRKEPKFTHLLGIPDGCCPLCKGALQTDDLLHTQDCRVVVRGKRIAILQEGEAAVFRELLRASGRGFRVARSILIDSMYSGAIVPISADHILKGHICTLRKKLSPLSIGVRAENGIVTLAFTAKTHVG